MFWYFYVNYKCLFYLWNSNSLAQSDHRALQKIFTGITGNEKCNTGGLEATTILRHVKLQHIKDIANILADCVIRFKADGLYHDMDLQKSQSDFGTHFEPLPTIE